ncbi:hypothetical protein GCM10027422_02260 [Hymenobacter arcticus]
MASFIAELRVAGLHYPLVGCTYATSQATSDRGRVHTKVRHEPVQLELDVPEGDDLLAWANEAHKRLAADIVFLDATGRPLETLSLKAAYCINYHELFVSAHTGRGAYRCLLTLVDPGGFTLHAGGPATAFVAPPPGTHGEPAGAAATAAAAAPAALTKKQRYDARMKKIDAAHAQLADNATPAAGLHTLPADATRVAPSAGVQQQQQDRQRLQKATDRLTLNNAVVERAKLSDDSYNNEVLHRPDGSAYLVHHQKQPDGSYLPSAPPEGWQVDRVIQGQQSGFMAVVYKSDFERSGKPVVVFRGTDADPGFPEELKKDGATDAMQGLGFYTDAYKQTENLARSLQKSLGSSFDIAGHSLGGGEASLVGLLTGNDTYTFNAAGLHENSMLRAGLDPKQLLAKEQKIQAFYSDQDPLNWNQDHSYVVKGIIKKLLPPYTPMGMPPIPSPLDGLIDDPRTMPAAVGIRRKLQDGGGHWSPAMVDGAGHAVPPMVAALEKQKDADLSTINQLVPAAR